MPNSISRFVGTELSKATTKQHLNISDMADALGINIKTFSGYKVNHRGMPAAAAVQTANYLSDSKFNAEMAGKFFHTLQMFSTKMWAAEDQENPQAVYLEQQVEEAERQAKDRDLFHNLHKLDDKKQAEDWEVELLEEISMELLLGYLVAERHDIDLVKLIIQHNKKN
ncbi:hypothetical protein [Paucilactobacillus nenjiangensis]|uniref:hypothetical protein n=1 Tax=Paucilactobacillus nenjiangensis TaxID=1296540 RepID=UPI003BB4B8AC